MVFNSAAFLFLFLPLSLLLYLLIPGKRGKNLFLCLASAVFYGFGGLRQLPVLLLSAAWNTCFGLLLGRESPRRRLWLGLGVAGNLALLGFYKYLGFLLEILGLPALAAAPGLPLGISFFTFHGVSYLADVSRDPGLVCRRADRLFLYLAFFPRLLAGPIVSWREAERELEERELRAEDVSAALRRFVLGMSKKLLLSEGAAAVANAVWALPGERLGAGLAWLGAASYCLQIYFDFSGYSDMAIGLGRAWGFHFPENFRYPYAARSLSDFWRRWHMTLNRWFVDYLYIPLGGSRRGERVTVRNKLIVFFFTGLWHGAGWTFILWGLWHGLFVSLEGMGERRLLTRLERTRPGRAALHVYTLLVVLAGFVMFRSESVGQGLFLLGRMFSFTGAGLAGRMAAEAILTPGRLAALGAGALFSLPVFPALGRRLLPETGERGPGWELAGDLLALAGLGVCVLAISGGGFSPFIYQQF